jgi:hypothetical protein
MFCPETATACKIVFHSATCKFRIKKKKKKKILPVSYFLNFQNCASPMGFQFQTAHRRRVSNLRIAAGFFKTSHRRRVSKLRIAEGFQTNCTSRVSKLRIAEGFPTAHL